MNNIQKLIEFLKMKISEAHKRHEESYDAKNYANAQHWNGRHRAYEIALDEAELLLKDESKQPQPPDFANTVLGEVPPVVKDGTEEHSKAVEGATPVVRQNEQQLKLCKTCGAEFNDLGTGGSYCGIKCFDKDVLQSG